MVSEPSEVSQPSSVAVVSKNTSILFKYSLSVKLSNDNHLLLKQQVMAIVKDHNLTHFLESVSRLSKSFSPDDKAIENIHVEFSDWEQ